MHGHETSTLFTLDCTKNVDLDKYECRRFGIRFDSRSEFSLPDGNVIDWNVIQMSLLLELIWAHQCILIIKKEIS